MNMRALLGLSPKYATSSSEAARAVCARVAAHYDASTSGSRRARAAPPRREFVEGFTVFIAMVSSSSLHRKIEATLQRLHERPCPVAHRATFGSHELSSRCRT